jgi:choline kinase
MARDFFLGQKDSAAQTGELLMLDADIVFPSDLLPYLNAQPSPNKIAVRVQGDHDEEEVRVKIDRARNVLAIGKATPLAETYGESIGIEIFSSSSARRLFEILEKRVRSGEGRTEYYETTFQQMIDEGERLSAIDVSHFATVEIDTPEDLLAAEEIVASQTHASGH